MTTGRGSDGRAPDPLVRALAVVALVCVAAVALQARQGLDWHRLAEPVEVRWARVLLGSVFLLVLAAAARRILRRLHRPSTRPDGDEHAEAEGEPFPWLLRLLGALLILGTLVAAFFVVSSFGPPPRGKLPPPPTGVPSGLPGQGAQAGQHTGTTSTLLGVVCALLLLVALAARWHAARRAGDTEDDQGPAERAEVERLVAAVDAAGVGLRAHADPRAAVLAAYAAMAGQLSSGLVRRGGQTRPSDTAGELLDHAVAAGLVGGPPARILTDLFREARYSQHPMGEDARRRALDCLDQVRAELEARRG